MPFVSKDHREDPCMSVPGDVCFLFYREIMKQWRAKPCWTTIDLIASELFPDQFQRAHFLAFMVFFMTHGMQYELKKRAENGEVTE